MLYVVDTDANLINEVYFAWIVMCNIQEIIRKQAVFTELVMPASAGYV